MKNPLIMAHRGGDCFGTENSLAAIRKSLKHHPEIIELDVRKSKDNILFCYHGNAIEYIFSHHFFKSKAFPALRKKYLALCTLKEAAAAVGNKSILFLDLQDPSLTKDEIIRELNGIPTKEVWLASRDKEQLKALGNLPKKWKKVHNGMFIYNLQRALEEGVDIVELFSWNYTPKHIAEVRKSGMDVALCHRFISPKKHTRKCYSTGSAWIMKYKFHELAGHQEKFRQ